MKRRSLLAVATFLLSPYVFAQTEAPRSRTFDIEAFDFGFRITPPAFFVNQGDSVTLRVKGSGHGFALERYVPNGGALSDEPITIQFVADKQGVFSFGCTESFCGFGHFDMHGVFEVVGPDTKPFTITAFEPSAGASAGGDLLTISGTGFVEPVSVFFGSAAASLVFVQNETTLVALAPPHSEGNVPITVKLESGRGTTSTRPYTYIAPLSIGLLSPAAGRTAGGTKVVIHGSGFLNASLIEVRFGATAAVSVQVLDPETLLATAPAHAPGAVDVIVTVGGASVTARGVFTYTDVVKRRAVR